MFEFGAVLPCTAETLQYLVSWHTGCPEWQQSLRETGGMFGGVGRQQWIRGEGQEEVTWSWLCGRTDLPT